MSSGQLRGQWNSEHKGGESGGESESETDLSQVVASGMEGKQWVQVIGGESMTVKND